MKCYRCDKGFAEGESAFEQVVRLIRTTGASCRVRDRKVLVCEGCSVC